MKKGKITLFVALFVLSGFFTYAFDWMEFSKQLSDTVNSVGSATIQAQEMMDKGYFYIGLADSESECSDSAARNGYRYYTYYYDTEGCYGKR